MNYFLGIDIGATKSHALIADETGQAVGFGTAGPGNHEVVGYDGLIAVLDDITTQAVTRAGITRADIAGAGFGVAGYDWPSEREPTLEAIATLGLACPVEAVNDTVIGLLAGASEGWGIAVVMGTGENCWGWDQARRTGHVTGNGGDFGEFGGSGTVVRRAVQAVSKAWSLRGPQTALTEAFCRKTGAKDADDLLEGIVLERYHLHAGYAPLVFQTALAGDEVARGAIAWAGEQLADLAIGVIHQLNFEDREFEIVLTGSLYEGGALILDPMKKAIWQVAPRAKFVRLNAPPVVGGTLLGMEMGGVDGYAVREKLVESTRKLVSGA
ncbi:MAG TPA: BadF/BadG/BcrA/BcrD ATPase family protein [Anaerolineales bacterium]|nr:BadF/BadG/BcrA/BcrD ATPase family protein [Anaerolineales bacterium]